MKYNIPPENFLFLLAYAFDLDWDYLEGQVKKESFENTTFLQLFSFVLNKWTEELIRKGLYRTFNREVRETKKIKGRILFDQTIKKQPFKTNSVVCQYDNLSFNTLENQIVLSTLKYCRQQLASEQKTARSEIFNYLDAALPKQFRLLNTAVSYQPLTRELFNQLTYHRTNIKYKPILSLCQLIYERSGVQKLGEDFLFDLDEESINNIFEEFLRSYLEETLSTDGYNVQKQAVSTWIVGKDQPRTKHIPQIEPDIVIQRKKKPQLVLDAKFYKKPVYSSNARYGNKETEKVYKTKSNNLYQILAYSSYYNCDGILIYAQTKQGHFEEQCKINPVNYPNQQSPQFNFGFLTLDLSGSLEEFQNRMESFAYSIERKIEQQL